MDLKGPRVHFIKKTLICVVPSIMFAAVLEPTSRLFFDEHPEVLEPNEV